MYIIPFFSDDSFASSEPTERDICLEWSCRIDNEEHDWSFESEEGILISGKEIKTIEFSPIKPEEGLKMDDKKPTTDKTMRFIAHGHRGHGKLPSREKIREVVRKKLKERSSLTSKPSSNPGTEQE